MTASDITVASPATRGRGLNITLWVGQVILALFFVFAGLPKVFGQAEAVASFETIGFGQWFRIVTGVVEIAGGIGLLIPRLSGLAAIGLVGVMVGATLTNLFLLPGMAPAAVMTVLLGVVFGLIAWGRAPQTKALLNSIKRN